MTLDYEHALRRVREQHGAPLEPGSEDEAHALERFKAFFSDFSPDRIGRMLERTYAPDIWFNDTLKTLVGRPELGEYLRHSAEAVEQCVVEVQEVLANGRGDYYFRWNMMIRFKRFSRGTDTHSIGISHVRFDREGLVVLHQDFWNAADGIFQHIPLLGWAIRAIKRRV